jgi:hypothetical protein
MTRWCVGVWCLLGAIAARADDPVFSGPQVGEALTSFRATAFSGPRAGREVELPGEFAGKPTVLVFVHEITRPALQLIRPVDHYAAKWVDAGLNGRIVWLAADPAQAQAYLERARDSLSLRSPVVIAHGGVEGPGNYGLNRNVTLTILAANEGKVTANFAIVQPNETDAPRVLAAVARLVGKPAPSAEEIRAELGSGPARKRRETAPAAGPGREAAATDSLARIEALEAQVASLTEALNEARAKIAKLEGTPPPAPLLNQPALRAGKASADPELQGLMRRLIGPRADRSEVDEAARAMARWAGDDGRKKSELAEYCRLVLGLGYGTDAARDALKRMAGD